MGILLSYTLKSAFCLTLFYPAYRLLLSKETFHRFNRIALLTLLVLSYLLPLLSIGSVPSAMQESLVQSDLTAIPTVTETMPSTPTTATAMAGTERARTLLWIYLLGGIGCMGYQLMSFARLGTLLRKAKRAPLPHNPQGKPTRAQLYVHDEEVAPFSWMHLIVVSRTNLEENGRAILIHELAHIFHRHSWDLLLTDICLIVQWFNPTAWLLKQELRTLHEYEADDMVVKSGIDAKEYQTLLIKKVVGTRLYSMANNLNHSSLKKRLTMMMKEKSHPWARLKYLYVLPLAAISMVAFAHTEAANNSNGISEAKGTEVLANNQIPGVKSSENEKVLIVVDGKLTIQETGPIDWTNEDLAKHIGVTPEEIAQIEVIKKPEILAQWNIPGATGAILVTTKKAKAADETAEAAKEKFTVTINDAGEYSYGPMGGTLTKGSLEDIADYITKEREKLMAAGGGQYFTVNVKVGKNTPMGSVEKLKNTLRKAWALRITYGLMEDENPVVVVHVNDKGEYSYGYKGETMEEASLERITNFIEAVQLDRIDKQKEGPLLRVSLSVDKNAPAESVEKLKIAIRESHISKLEYNMASEQKEALIDYLKLNGQPRLNEESNAIEWGSAEEVFMVVENMPEFPGGTAELMKFLAQNIKYPVEAQQKGEQGRVMVQFVVGKDGKLSDIKIMRSKTQRFLNFKIGAAWRIFVIFF